MVSTLWLMISAICLLAMYLDTRRLVFTLTHTNMDLLGLQASCLSITPLVK